ncbi:Fe-S oxidoreductase [Slackia faecicanis]|uniref:Fe-S oxidoreductase n=1 Tax=Slackia faecicanis TaxID=255723 RepID=A0A3N0AGV1_9ACTN|nr:aldo/keto reductase [Slackia faecicanis]RNL20719.1 Fe-S oxidoreductase [Slackia faecicanis]
MSDIRTDHDFAPLGFGFMRLPEIERDGRTVFDHDAVCAMVDEFMNAGFTYFDTAYGYHNGRSECELKAALVDRYPREAYTIATKLPAWMADDAARARAMFDESLAKLGIEYFDYYLLHNLGGPLTEPFDDYGLWDYVAEKREQGLIRHLGFSIHDKADALEEVLAKHADIKLDFVQLQINYADWESTIIESRKCYEVARAHGLPVVIMEPVKGGSLVNLPPAAADILREADPSASPASWALRFCASLPGVAAVLSGMSTIEQVRDNVKTFSEARPLDDAERAVLDRVRTVLDGIETVPCTDCRYCMKGCPEGVHIPTIMDSLNIMSVFGDMHRAKENYIWNATGGEASKCIQCGACEEVCPQKIGIIDQLERAAGLFEE